ncbi:uncharacterized protein A4U43_C09F4350 [Asparagus officinalis]|uniref:KAT8 regulatory NSL complex subunit 2 n=1 Tax=Asparagus officinalis TaxID=4686 RepID=A0A5P1E723_ASPOF|nr:uncharacterized protein A4U43_C09F4350 [Asparagus officinalis]
MPTGSANASGIKLQNPPERPNPNPNPNLDPMSARAPPARRRRSTSPSSSLARRAKHRDYYWEFGKSPLEGEEEENEEGERKRCGTSGCKSKAMPLTTYCHQHILSDKKQTLYKGCAFATKSSQPKCGKPILRSTVPSLCHVHYQRNQRQISQALKKAGLNSSNKAPPKFHVLISECVRQIQARRREKLMATTTADKFFDSSLRTTDTREMRVIGKKPPPVEKKFTSLRGRLQDSVGRMMASSPDKAQLSPSMTKVK